MKILSWNVNGIRAAQKHGLLQWLYMESPDIFCVQETKAQPGQLGTDLLEPPEYYTYWNYPERKGYSGVATFTKDEPFNVNYEFSTFQADQEGRTIITEFEEFTLMNIYFPNGKKDQERLSYKMEFYESFLDFVKPLIDRDEKLIVCGDVNTAHKEIDLSHPKGNEKVSGFLPIEREWIDRFVENGFIDTFRHFNKDPEQYTWWDVKSRARERNIGWRIDYFFISENLLPYLAEAFIMPEVMGSDHCPIGITLHVP
ncbi:MAG: exodeoxyribonuclease III [Dehalococcoidales bacterium]|nr:MAG: exodeoxyribonuclease III [Dehalococcoidales bacterium]